MFWYVLCPVGWRSLRCDYVFNQVHWERWQCHGVQPGQRPQVSPWPQHRAQRHQAREPLGTSFCFFLFQRMSLSSFKMTFQSPCQSCNKGLSEFKYRKSAWCQSVTIKYEWLSWIDLHSCIYCVPDIRKCVFTEVLINDVDWRKVSRKIMKQKILKKKLETELAAYRRQEEHKHSFMCRTELWKI